MIHKLKNKLNKIIKLLVLTNNESYKSKKLWKTVTAISARHKNKKLWETVTAISARHKNKKLWETVTAISARHKIYFRK